MTEAGELWIEEHKGDGYLTKDHVIFAEFWIRTFVDEVAKREAKMCTHTDKHCQECSSVAFDEVVRELLGDST